MSNCRNNNALRKFKAMTSAHCRTCKDYYDCCSFCGGDTAVVNPFWCPSCVCVRASCVRVLKGGDEVFGPDLVIM